MELGINSYESILLTDDIKLTHPGSSSATNISIIFDKVLSKESDDIHPRTSPTGTIILDCFFLHSLLRGAHELGIRLELPHNCDHGDRLAEAMHSRNQRSAGTGLEHWAHRCNDCFKEILDVQDGRECKSISGLRLSFEFQTVRIDVISAVVTDGVTVGHPCCNEHNCKIPLKKVYDEYCPLHFAMNSKCAITDCNNPRVAGSRTCNRKEHREEEERRAQRGKKRKRGRGARKAGDGAQAKRPANVDGVFSRRWTHNEQLMVRPCGIVIARATFFGAESVSAVKVTRKFFT